MAKQHDKQFKLDAVQYYFDHKELGVRGCAQNLGVGYSTLTKWLKDFRELVLCQEKVQIKHAFFKVGLPCQSFCFFV